MDDFVLMGIIRYSISEKQCNSKGRKISRNKRLEALQVCTRIRTVILQTGTGCKNRKNTECSTLQRAVLSEE